MRLPELEEGTPISLVRPITPFLRWESSRRVRFLTVKDGKPKEVFSDKGKDGKLKTGSKKTRRKLGG
ncbi:hypothetical protein V6N13_049501 [Hibiscus sabdariffa]